MPELTMDRVYERLVEVIHTLRFLHRNWKHLTNPEEILDAATQELANITTPGHPETWRLLAESNGVKVPD